MYSKLFQYYLLSAILFSWSLADRQSDDELLKWEPPGELKKNFPYYLCGTDEEGSEVWLIESAKWDMREVTTAGGERLADFRKYVQQMFTRMTFKSKDLDKSEQSVLISNMDGLTYEVAFHGKALLESLQVTREMIKFVRAGGFKRGYFVNANAVFEVFAWLLMPLLGDLANQVEVYGTNSERWLPKLLKQIPKSQLPGFLGGDKNHKYVAVYG